METKRMVFLEGKRVVLRPLNKATDLELTVRWMNDPDIRYVTTRTRPISREEEGEWFDSLKGRPNDIIFAIEVKESGEFIGVMGIHKIDLVSGTAVTGAIIGEKRHWGKGYGTEAKFLLLRYAFEELGLRKVRSSVLAHNKRSLAYSKKCGYVVEGVLKKQHLKRGKFCDEVLLAVFKDGWKKARSASRRPAK